MCFPLWRRSRCRWRSRWSHRRCWLGNGLLRFGRLSRLLHRRGSLGPPIGTGPAGWPLRRLRPLCGGHSDARRQPPAGDGGCVRRARGVRRREATSGRRLEGLFLTLAKAIPSAGAPQTCDDHLRRLRRRGGYRCGWGVRPLCRGQPAGRCCAQGSLRPGVARLARAQGRGVDRFRRRRRRIFFLGRLQVRKA